MVVHCSYLVSLSQQQLFFLKKYFLDFTGGTTQTGGDKAPDPWWRVATQLHLITADPRHLTMLNMHNKINCWRSPDQSAVEAGTEVQIVPDHDAMLWPCKYSSCSSNVRGKFPCSRWSAWTKGMWQFSGLAWWRPLFVQWSDISFIPL